MLMTLLGWGFGLLVMRTLAAIPQASISAHTLPGWLFLPGLV
jgi:hypothetical protein